MFLSTKKQIAIAIAAALLAVVGHASAGDSDVANVRIISGGAEEAVEIEMNDLKVGESRQLTAASGKPAVVTRTEEGLTVEVAGKRTEVVFPQTNGEMTWVSNDEPADGKQIRVIKIDRDETHAAGEGAHRVIVMKHADGDTTNGAELEVITENLVGADGEISDARLQELISDVQIKHGEGDADGEQVIVTRRIVRDSESQ